MSIEQSFLRYRQHGDIKALGEVFDAVAQELLLVAAHLVPTGVEAEDLVQATFVEAIEHAERYDTGKRLTPWLIGILINHVRRERRRATKSPPIGASTNGPTNPLDVAEQQEVGKCISEALHGLPMLYRQVLTLRLLHGLQPTQIATALGCPVATCKTRLQRGMEMLRNALPRGIGVSVATVFMVGKGLANCRQVIIAKAATYTVGTTATLTTVLTGVAMKKIVVAIGVLALGTWVICTEAGRDALPVPTQDSNSPSVQANDTTDRDAIEEASEHGLQRSNVKHDATPPTSNAKMLKVRVVDAVTMKPEPATEIVWYDSSFDWNRLTDADQELRRHDLEQVLRSKANTTTTDSQGRATLPISRWVSMLVRSGDKYASGVWRPDVVLETAAPFAGEFLLKLQTDRTLFVRAVDAERTPVPDVIVQLQRTHRLFSGVSSQSLQSLPPTGPNGITQLRHAQESFATTDRIIAAEMYARLSGENGKAVAIDPNALPEGPIDVVLPAFGSVLVEVLGPDGAPWPLHDSGKETVQLVAPDWNGGTLEPGLNSQPLDRQRQAVFPHVRCGLRFVVEGPTGWDESDEFEGPTRPGEQIQVVLRMSADAILVAGRALQGDRTPSAGAITLRAQSQRGSGQVRLSPDDSGRFCVPMPKHLAGATSVDLEQRDESGVMQFQTSVTLRTPLAPGRNNIGDVVLAEAPLFVAGQISIAGGDDSAGVLDRLQIDIERYDALARNHWQTAYVGASLDEGHRFSIRGRFQGDRFRLVVNGDFVPLPPREFLPGTDDLAIQIASGGNVTATFVPTPISAWLVCRLVPDFSMPPSNDWRQASREMGQMKHRDGHLTEIKWCGLKAGNHRLLVGCQGEDPMLNLLVRVPNGGAANDPRLLDIDMHDQLRLVCVKVTDAARSPLHGTATIVMRGRLEDRVTWHGQELGANSGQGSVFGVSRPVDLLVIAPGHRGAVATGVFCDTTVALSRAPKVALHWVDPPSLPEGVTAAVVWAPKGWPTRGPSLHVVGTGGNRSGLASRILSGQRQSAAIENGRATLIAEAPYPLQIRLRLRKKGKPTQFLTLQPNMIDPTLLTSGQVIDVRTDAAALAVAMQTIAGK